MTTDDDNGTTDDEQALADLLSDPSVWAENSDTTEDAIVAAIAAEAAMADRVAPAPDIEPVAATAAAAESSGADVVAISSARSWFKPFAAGVAAALLVFGGFAVALRGGDDASGVELALAGTELAPEAEATVNITETPIGTRIMLDVSGLAPSAPGTYYEAWMRIDGETGVSAGTFHLRGGEGELELWSAVPIDDYPLFTITIQDEAVPTSSGVVVLKGLFVDE